MNSCTNFFGHKWSKWVNSWKVTDPQEKPKDKGDEPEKDASEEDGK